jgi:dihydrofolate synthase/folylpolyglutamate synthase
MRKGVPCFCAAQPNPLALESLQQAAQATGASLSAGAEQWTVHERHDSFIFSDYLRSYSLPKPALLGAHQYQNAGLAIAALSVLPRSVPSGAVAQGLRQVEWPARLQRLADGALAGLIAPGAELWLDGGHNDSAGEALAAQIERWRHEDGGYPRPLHVVLGMLTTKRPAEFLLPFATRIAQLRTVPVPDEALGFQPAALAEEARAAGVTAAEPRENVAAALRDLALAASGAVAPRVLICGSLYLAGAVLRENGASGI